MTVSDTAQHRQQWRELVVAELQDDSLTWNDVDIPILKSKQMHK